ncbi:MAG TPA: IPT/TIG domain-containing protein [Vicinamibacterales bacterium]|nr:IPT/TIG domain-containing protein [Vicinamibacterales bacterium]
MMKPLPVTVIVAALGAALGCGNNPASPGRNNEPLTIVSVTPNSGPSTVATPLSIGGTGFRAGARVTVGGVEVVSNVLTPARISASAPAHAVGPVDVVVSQSSASEATLPGGFTYLPGVDRIAISGNLVLARIGETSQLTVTATFTDGTTRDVTTSARWEIARPSIARIGPDGVLVALAEGGTGVSAQYPAAAANSATRFGSAQVVVTPPGTFVLSGRTREPGAGDLNGVLVRNPASGRSVVSANGGYTLAGLTDDRLSLTLDGFEPREMNGTRNGFDDVPMQRILRANAGGPAVASELARNDSSYDVGGGAQCQPCRLIRITGAGSMAVRLTWTAPTRVLSLWVNGTRITGADGSQELVTTITGNGEAVVYVGSTEQLGFSEHVRFTISVQ